MSKFVELSPFFPPTAMACTGTICILNFTTPNCQYSNTTWILLMNLTCGMVRQNFLQVWELGRSSGQATALWLRYLPPSMLEHSAYLSLPACFQTDGKTIHLMSMAKTPKIYLHVFKMLHGINFGHTDNFMWSACREMSRRNRKTCCCGIQ